MTCAVGLDIGSTAMKAVAVAPELEPLASVSRPTPWRSVGEGWTEMTADDLVATVRDLVEALHAELGGRPVGAIGVSGMAESGVLLDPEGRVVRAIPAWFDPRGGAEFAAASGRFRDEFSGRTGLPVSALATLAKLLHHRASGLEPAGLTWLNVPEYVAHVLGGERLGEVSLVARTGLVDQDTGRPWPDAFAALGTGPELLPPTRPAGAEWGRADAVPPSMRGAVLTVAGHDHLVASVAAGVVRPDQLYDSIGTAEALVRVLEHPLDPVRRSELAASGINVVRHLLPGRWTMLAGTRGGLVLRRVLRMVGVDDDSRRDALDAEVMAVPPDDVGAIEVSGAANTTSTLSIRVDTDDLSPARVVAAAVAHGTAAVREAVAVMDAHVGPPAETVVAGGWARMAAVRRARQEALPAVRFSSLDEDTAFGAALLGRFAAQETERDLIDFLNRTLRSSP